MEMLGRVVNTLGQPIDGKGPIDTQRPTRLKRLHQGLFGGSQ
jgi:F0F1-type ATP synthase alpha subunit